jgi:hypothetical protein
MRIESSETAFDTSTRIVAEQLEFIAAKRIARGLRVTPEWIENMADLLTVQALDRCREQTPDIYAKIVVSCPDAI